MKQKGNPNIISGEKELYDARYEKQKKIIYFMREKKQKICQFKNMKRKIRNNSTSFSSKHNNNIKKNSRTNLLTRKIIMMIEIFRKQKIL